VGIAQCVAILLLLMYLSTYGSMMIYASFAPVKLPVMNKPCSISFLQTEGCRCRQKWNPKKHQPTPPCGVGLLTPGFKGAGKRNWHATEKAAKLDQWSQGQVTFKMPCSITRWPSVPQGLAPVMPGFAKPPPPCDGMLTSPNQSQSILSMISRCSFLSRSLQRIYNFSL